MFTVIAVTGLFILLGILFLSGRGAFLIAGYNTLPKREKEKYDTPALTRFMGKMMFAIAFSMLVWQFGEYIEAGWLVIAGHVLLIGSIAFILIYGNTGNRFKKEEG